jgi:hypothetical protein
MGVESGGSEAGASCSARFKDWNHRLLEAVHCVPDEVLAVGREVIEVVNELVTVFVAVSLWVSGRTAVEHSLSAIKIERAALQWWIGARWLTHGICWATITISAVGAILIANLVNDDFRVVEVVDDVRNTDVIGYSLCV